jgi:hypothetical protein
MRLRDKGQLLYAIALGECRWRNESRGARCTDNTSEKSMMSKDLEGLILEVRWWYATRSLE